MVKNKDAIAIFARLRPVSANKEVSEYIINKEFEKSTLEMFKKQTNRKNEFVNNTREHYTFKFDGIFDTTAKQEEVFENCAKPCVLSALDGYNSTIFAYGQTGSGKTWTMTGGPSAFEDRGIIPRTLALIFQEIEEKKDQEFVVSVSYLEIYNNSGYDLLDKNREAQDMKDLPKVTVLTDSNGNILLGNINCHIVKTQDDALNILFVGDNNRVISETAMNDVSTRSHCIFTINIENRTIGSRTVKYSKLHLVDLAGSERVAKTNSEGKILEEARHINLSLHYLQQVIVALSENQDHVPYRNTVLTTVLRDSIGGNCKTVMIATLNPHAKQLEETISTCYFSQRVASVKQKAVQNERLDSATMIKNLKEEVTGLKEQLKFYKKGEIEREIDENERSLLKEKLDLYINDGEKNSILKLGGDFARVLCAFQIFKNIILEFKRKMRHANKVKPDGETTNSEQKPIEDPEQKQAETEKPPDLNDPNVKKVISKEFVVQENVPVPKTVLESLKHMKTGIELRDLEIGLLVSMLKKEQEDICEVAIQTEMNFDTNSGQNKPTPQNVTLVDRIKGISKEELVKAVQSRASELQSKQLQQQQTYNAHNYKPGANISQTPKLSQEDIEKLANKEVLLMRAKAFEEFRKSYRRNGVIEKGKDALKDKFNNAKELANELNKCRYNLTILKQKLVASSQQKNQNSEDPEEDDENNEGNSAEEQALKQEIFLQRNTYNDLFEKLKNIKKEIEYTKKGMEMSSERMQRDFLKWYKSTGMAKQEQKMLNGTKKGQIDGNEDENEEDNQEEEEEVNVDSEEYQKKMKLREQIRKQEEDEEEEERKEAFAAKENFEHQISESAKQENQIKEENSNSTINLTSSSNNNNSNPGDSLTHLRRKNRIRPKNRNIDTNSSSIQQSDPEIPQNSSVNLTSDTTTSETSTIQLPPSSSYTRLSRSRSHSLTNSNPESSNVVIDDNNQVEIDVSAKRVKQTQNPPTIVPQKLNSTGNLLSNDAGRNIIQEEQDNTNSLNSSITKKSVFEKNPFFEKIQKMEQFKAKLQQSSTDKPKASMSLLERARNWNPAKTGAQNPENL